MGRRQRGYTVLEVLVASALLLVLTGLLFETLVPAFRRSAGLDEQQSIEQSLVLFREHVNRRVRGARVLLPANLLEEQEALRFVQRASLETALGSLPDLRVDGEVQWEPESRAWTLFSEEVERQGTGAKAWVVGERGPRGTRVLCPPGSGFQVTYDFSHARDDIPQVWVRIHLKVPYEPRPQLYTPHGGPEQPTPSRTPSPTPSPAQGDVRYPVVLQHYE